VTAVRLMFTATLLIILGGLAYFTALGLMHR
jgi:hypothetical protein